MQMIGLMSLKLRLTISGLLVEWTVTNLEMGKSILFPLTTSPFTTRRQVKSGNLSQLRSRRRASQEIKLNVIDTFRNTIKVKSLIETDDSNNFKTRTTKSYPSDKKRWNNLNNKICWWEPPLECLPLDFCRDTSLHGLKYIGQPKRHMSERIFWSIAFLVGICAAVYLISDVWRKYKASPVIVTFDPSETNIDRIPFPAVTICNMNKVLKSKANEYIDAAKSEHLNISDIKNLFTLNHVCTSSKSFTKRFNFSASHGHVSTDLVDKISNKINVSYTTQGAIQDFLQVSSQSCEDMIPLCIWHDAIVPNCSTLFRPIETDFGKCCTFNMVPQTLLRIFQNDTRDDQNETEKWSQWNAEEGGLFPIDESTPRLELPRRQIRAGKSFGLSILLDPDLDEYFCTTSDSIGFRLSTHLSTETPHVIDFGLGINPNSEVFVDIRPEVTVADPTIHDYDLEKRLCYFPGEFNLRYYNYYTVANCIDECVANVTYNNCSCVRFYMPRDNDQNLCDTKTFDCVDRIKGELADAGLKKFCDHCLPPCTEINYGSETTSTPMQEDFNIWESDDPLHLSAKWSKNKVSIVHIFFGTDSTYARVRKQLYGVTDLIANTGGLMGLCLGFSGLSAMEVIYFLSLRAWCRKRRKKTIGDRIAQKFRDIWTKLKAVNTYGKHSRENSKTQQTNLFLSEYAQSQQQQHNHILPVVSINNSSNIQSIQNRVFTTTVVDNNLPDYSSVVNEINPYYTKRYWKQLEMKNEL